MYYREKYFVTYAICFRWSNVSQCCESNTTKVNQSITNLYDTDDPYTQQDKCIYISLLSVVCMFPGFDKVVDS